MKRTKSSRESNNRLTGLRNRLKATEGQDTEERRNLIAETQQELYTREIHRENEAREASKGDHPNG